MDMRHANDTQLVEQQLITQAQERSREAFSALNLADQAITEMEEGQYCGKEIHKQLTRVKTLLLPGEIGDHDCGHRNIVHAFNLLVERADALGLITYYLKEHAVPDPQINVYTIDNKRRFIGTAIGSPVAVADPSIPDTPSQLIATISAAVAGMNIIRTTHYFDGEIWQGCPPGTHVLAYASAGRPIRQDGDTDLPPGWVYQ
jgi:hypothetical protein